MSDKHAIEQSLSIMAKLRDPESGCPWDLKQDFKSIVPHTLEEAYEVADCIEKGELTELKSELGDLLFGFEYLAQQSSHYKTHQSKFPHRTMLFCVVNHQSYLQYDCHLVDLDQ